MKAIAILGAAWGDEGKGAATDKLASVNETPLVVRHNGGSQAGHTVVTPDGKRHVFSHFCSGAAAGAPSYLSEYFVVNPRTFIIERNELLCLGANLLIGVHPKAMVTTPLDVAFNRGIETKRGAGRHGSVGIGFGETIERTERGFPLLVEDLGTPVAQARLEKIRDEWLPLRKAELGVDINFGDMDWGAFFGECHLFIYNVKVMTLKEAAKGHQTIIFEGAQGLLLDQTRGMTFPHVTRSNTGLQNVVPLMEQLGLKLVRVVYMMRPYLTRHGAGPLPGEVSELKGVAFEDKTNVTGPWQGNFRLAPLDPDLVLDAIQRDISDVTTVTVEPYIGLSCVDQGLNKQIPTLLGAFPGGLSGHGPRRDNYYVNSKLKSQRTTLVGSDQPAALQESV